MKDGLKFLALWFTLFGLMTWGLMTLIDALGPAPSAPQ